MCEFYINHQSKMKTSKSLFLAIAVSFSVLTAVNNNSSNKAELPIEPKEFIHEFKGEQEAITFRGVVLSLDKTPLSNAVITIGDSVVISDTKGEFEIYNHLIDKDFISIKAESEGFKAKSMVLKEKNKAQALEIVLKPYDSLSLHWFSEHNYLID